jgi:hypothetical protein
MMVLLLLGWLPQTAVVPSAPAAPAGQKPLPASALCTTHGAITTSSSGGMAIEHPEVRAVAAGNSAPEATLRFTYLGPTAQSAPLSSGELRRQIGLKLKAKDSCNVVYIMWRIEPKPGLVVSIKRNPGKRTNAECGVHGYRTVKPDRSRDVPTLAPGAAHTLSAIERGDSLSVIVDGQTVWQGSLGPEALEIDGPVGLRTDNGRFTFEFSAPPEAAGTCGKGVSDS